MFGAIIGDIVGSRYEGSGMRSKRFAMFAPECHFTDDTVMTVAVARALLECDWHEEEVYKEILVRQMRRLGRAYPNAGYGEQFKHWLFSENPQPTAALATARRCACPHAACWPIRWTRR